VSDASGTWRRKGGDELFLLSTESFHWDSGDRNNSRPSMERCGAVPASCQLQQIKVRIHDTVQYRTVLQWMNPQPTPVRHIRILPVSICDISFAPVLVLGYRYTVVAFAQKATHSLQCSPAPSSPEFGCSGVQATRETPRPPSIAGAD